MAVSRADREFWRDHHGLSASIHGIKYLTAHSAVRLQKVFWCGALSITTCLFVLLAYEVTSKYLSEQVIIRDSKIQMNISEILHPAMTYCLELKINSANATKEKGLFQLLNYLDFEQKIDFDINSLLTELKKRTQLEWFTNCVFGSFGRGVVMPFSTILTKHGMCFTFNMQPAKSMFNLDTVSAEFHYNNSFKMMPWSFDPTRQEVPPWRPTMTENTIFIDFRRRSCNQSCLACGQDYPEEDNPAITQYDESNAFQPFGGIHLITHSPDEYPLNHGQSVHLVSWAHNYLEFYPKMFLIDEEIMSWPLEKRNCYLEGEKELIYFKIYTKNNCEHECLSFLMSKKCGCVPFYLIRSPLNVLCGVGNKNCVKEMEANFYGDVGEKKTKCQCLDQCSYVQFQVNAKYASGLAATQLSTSFGSKVFIPTVKQRAFGFSDYLGSIGGLMGLFAGVSVISLVEVGFLLIVKLTKLRRQRITHEIIKVAPMNQTMDEKSVFSLCSAFFVTIISKSDVHGLSYIGKKQKSVVARLFWLIIVLTSLVACSYQIFNILKHSEMNPIEFAMDQKIWDVQNIPFPRVTLCPYSDFEKYYKHRACMDSNFCDDIDPEMVKILRDPVKGPKELRPIEFISWLRPKSEAKQIQLGPDFLNKLRPFTMRQRYANQSFCSIQNEMKLKEILTESGTCFTFNYDEHLINIEEVGLDFAEPKVYTATCKEQILFHDTRSISISVSDEGGEAFCTKRTYGEFIVYDSDQFYKYLSTRFHRLTSTRVVLWPKITTTDESLRKYSPKARQCYFSDEKRLRYFAKYSRSYCLQEYESIFMQKMCGCVRFNLLRNDSQRVCNNDDRSCGAKSFQTFNRETNVEYKKSDCLSDCESIDYNYEIINERMVSEGNGSIRETCYSLSIYFGSDGFVAYKRFESYGTVGLLSKIGGLLGLFFGLSVLSVVETIYFFTLRFLVDFWSKKFHTLVQ